jgi:hypothetical protein
MKNITREDCFALPDLGRKIAEGVLNVSGCSRESDSGVMLTCLENMILLHGLYGYLRGDSRPWLPWGGGREDRKRFLHKRRNWLIRTCVYGTSTTSAK